MNGPAHFSEGERLLAESEATSTAFNPEGAQTLAVQATAHFLTALTASHATKAHPDSVAWDRAINGQEQP